MLRFVVLVTIGLVMAPLAARAEFATSPQQRMLDLVNGHRRAAGLSSVTLDAKLSTGCYEHAKYMVLNRGKPAMQGLNAHKQDPKLPGATPGGAACAKAADLFPGVADLKTAVDGWMASLYHRRPILSPRLERIAFGFAALPDKTLMVALMFVDAKGVTDATGWPVGFPAKHQTNVPLEFGNEIPNPIPNNGSGGYPFTLQFPPFDKVTNVTATLVDGAGKAVPFHLSTPEQPATSFGQYGVVCVIPKETLRPNTRYVATVKATWQGETKTWSSSWKTVGLREVEASNEAAMLVARGHASLVRGTVQYGGMMNTATAYLTLATSRQGRYEMVSVIVPIALWQSFDKGTPESVKGAAVEVEATPQLVQNRYMNLPIASAGQLRFVAAPPTKPEPVRKR